MTSLTNIWGKKQEETEREREQRRRLLWQSQQTPECNLALLVCEEWINTNMIIRQTISTRSPEWWASHCLPSPSHFFTENHSKNWHTAWMPVFRVILQACVCCAELTRPDLPCRLDEFRILSNVQEIGYGYNKLKKKRLESSFKTEKTLTLCGCLTCTQNPNSLSILLSILITWFLSEM